MHKSEDSVLPLYFFIVQAQYQAGTLQRLQIEWLHEQYISLPKRDRKHVGTVAHYNNLLTIIEDDCPPTSKISRN